MPQLIMTHTPLPGWTAQRMADRIREKNTGVRCGAEDMCMYTHGGNRCAVGVFLPDDLEGFEHNGVGLHEYEGGYGALINDFPEFEELMPMDAFGMNGLQSKHDSWMVEDGDMRDFLVEWIRTHVAGGMGVTA